MRTPSTPLLPFVTALFLFAGGSAGLDAQEADEGHVQVGVAYLDVSARSGEAASLELTYRWPKALLWKLRPQAGVAAYSDGSLYGHGGAHLFLPLGDRISLIPSLGVGLFRGGREVDLGSALEFRSALGVGFRVAPRQWISVFLYHLSNGGLADRNPGVEVLGFGYSFQL